jgi:YggT family protein
MIAFGYFLRALAGMINLIIPLFYYLMIARVILSWVNPDPRNAIVQFIYNTTEPLLVKIRDKLPPIGMIDLSPLVCFLVLYFINAFLAASLCAYGNQFLLSSGVQAGACGIW